MDSDIEDPCHRVTGGVILQAMNETGRLQQDGSQVNVSTEHGQDGGNMSALTQV